MHNIPSVSIIVCSSPMVAATALMNANSVPKSVEEEFKAAAGRLAIFLHHVKTLPMEVEAARSDFFVHLERNWISYTAAVEGQKDLEYIAYSDGIGYLPRLHAILYEFKAFLDLFTRFVCRVTSSKPGPHGFNKGKINGRELSGGRLINWISGHTLEVVPDREPMVRALSTASGEWITDVVAIRDTLVHFRDLPGFRHMRISVSRGPKKLAPADILLPEMPDGRDLIAFSITLRDALCRLISDVLPFVPNVKEEMNEKWSAASLYLSE